jgi:L-iditol 2-dehydrogenase
VKAVVKTERGDGHVALLDVPEPKAKPGHVVLEVAATGVCGTDIHIFHDEFPYNTPVVLGHETAGTVVELGTGVSRVKVGDQVTAETFYFTCGKCLYCRTGQPNLCPERKSIGSHVNGAMTRYVEVPEQNCHILPDGVDTLSASITEPLACCVNAILLRGGVLPGDIALISGPGAIGQFAAQVAKAAGARTIVCGITGDERRLDIARQLGADFVVNALKDDLKGLVSDLTAGRGADVTIECAGASASLNQCLDQVRKGGTVLQMGLFGKSVSVAPDMITLKEVRYSGSFSHVPAAWPRALRLLAEGKVRSRPLITRQAPITEWDSAFSAFNARSECKIVLTPFG